MGHETTFRNRMPRVWVAALAIVVVVSASMSIGVRSVSAQSMSELRLSFEESDNPALTDGKTLSFGSPWDPGDGAQLMNTHGISRFRNVGIVRPESGRMPSDGSQMAVRQDDEYCCNGFGMEFAESLELRQVDLDIAAGFQRRGPDEGPVKVMAQDASGNLLFERLVYAGDLGWPDWKWYRVSVVSESAPIAALAVTDYWEPTAPFDWDDIIDGAGMGSDKNFSSGVATLAIDNLTMHFTGELPDPGPSPAPTIDQLTVTHDGLPASGSILADQWETSSGQIEFLEEVVAVVTVDAPAGLADATLRLFGPDGAEELIRLRPTTAPLTACDPGPCAPSVSHHESGFIRLVDRLGEWRIEARAVDSLGRQATLVRPLTVESGGVALQPEIVLDRIELVQGPSRQIIEPGTSPRTVLVIPDRPILLRAFASDLSNDGTLAEVGLRYWLTTPEVRTGPFLLEPNASVWGGVPTEAVRLDRLPADDAAEAARWLGTADAGGVDWPGVQSWVIPAEMVSLGADGPSRMEFDLQGGGAMPGSSRRTLTSPLTLAPMNPAPALGLHVVEVRRGGKSPMAVADLHSVAEQIVADTFAANPVARVELLSAEHNFRIGDDTWQMTIAKWFGPDDDCGTNLRSFGSAYGFGELPALVPRRGEIALTAVVGVFASGDLDSGGCAFRRSPDETTVCVRCGVTFLAADDTALTRHVTHELGHAVGLKHASADHDECGGGSCERDFPRHGQVNAWPLHTNGDVGALIEPSSSGVYDVTLIDPCAGETGADRAAAFESGSFGCPGNDRALHDVMSYGSGVTSGSGLGKLEEWGSGRWWSGINLDRLEAALRYGFCFPTMGGNPVAFCGGPSGDVAAAAGALVDASSAMDALSHQQDTLVVSGAVNPEGEVALLPTERLALRAYRESPNSEAAIPEGSVQVAITSRDGASLSTKTVHIEELADTSGASGYFTAYVALPNEDIGSITITGPSVVPLREDAGAAPRVFGSLETGVVRWEIDDPDSSQWLLTVERREDDTWLTNWTSVTTAARGAETIGTSSSPARLLVSDGVNVTAVSLSDGLCDDAAIVCASTMGATEAPEAEHAVPAGVIAALIGSGLALIGAALMLLMS